MHSEKLSYKETAKEFDIPQGDKTVAKWERIYLEEGAEGHKIEVEDARQQVVQQS